MLHAYWREWPGPRIWYGPYNAASRELFAALAAALREIAPHAIIERASMTRRSSTCRWMLLL